MKKNAGRAIRRKVHFDTIRKFSTIKQKQNERKLQRKKAAA